jgi:hypothetical protein
MTMLEFCDYIMGLIRDNLLAIDADEHKMLRSVTRMKYDLNEDGSLSSTKKVIHATDDHGTRYRITVEVER